MKFNKIAYLLATFAIVISSVTICVDAIDEATNIVTQDTGETEEIKKDAMEIMRNARQDLLAGNITTEELIEIIKEQSERIAQAEQKLKAVIYQAVAQTEESEGFLNYLISGAQNIGAQLIAPFKSGYGYSEHEKEIARKMIEELTQQKKEIMNDYKTVSDMHKDQSLTDDEFIELVYRWGQILDRLDDEINQQKIITGDVMSLKRKLFWAAIAAGTVVAGLALLPSSETVMPENVTMPTETPQTSTTTAEIKTQQSKIPAEEPMGKLPSEPPKEKIGTSENIKIPENEIPKTADEMEQDNKNIKTEDLIKTTGEENIGSNVLQAQPEPQGESLKQDQENVQQDDQGKKQEEKISNLDSL